jgi:putative polyketide hydroxylase
MKTIETPVLITGGGPAGLCISILLSHHGVPSLLVERHAHAGARSTRRLVVCSHGPKTRGGTT